jgi:hypothetical protein
VCICVISLQDTPYTHSAYLTEGEVFYVYRTWPEGRPPASSSAPPAMLTCAPHTVRT